MPDKPRRLRPIDGIVIFAVSQVVAVVATVVLALRISIRANTGISAVVVLCVAAALLRYTGRSPFRCVKLDRFRPGLVLYSILASLALIVPTLSLQTIIARYLTIPDAVIEALEAIVRAESLPELMYVWLIAALGAAVSEEFIFRGVLQNGFSSRLRGWIAVLITASVFAILHTIWRFPPAFILGVFLGVLYWRTGSLWPPIAAHLTINTVTIVTLYVAEVFGDTAVPQWLVEERPAPIWMIVLSMIAFAGLIRLIWTRSAAEQEETQSDGPDETVTVDTP
ncbi:MAG: CPBP family intramembrane glutamic endopeptidase [Candidatus Eisenbacteria bacterium]